MTVPEGLHSGIVSCTDRVTRFQRLWAGSALSVLPAGITSKHLELLTEVLFGTKGGSNPCTSSQSVVAAANSPEPSLSAAEGSASKQYAADEEPGGAGSDGEGSAKGKSVKRSLVLVSDEEDGSSSAGSSSSVEGQL